MTKTSIHRLNQLGQSVWLDNISRSLIETGRLKEMTGLGLRGMTSNPTIFDKAISSSTDYDEKILQLFKEGKTTFEIYDDLTIRDVRDAADIFLPVFEETGGLDGYVSLEINPRLAYKTKETIEEGKRLYQKVNRPNMMYKVPSTQHGFDAIEELVASGIDVNVTLIFSVEQYINTAHAYIRGLKRLLKAKGDISKIRSVASVFVSRIDTYVDNLLDEVIAKEKDLEIKKQLSSLKGKAAVSNSHLIYKEYLDISSSAEFKKLQDKGAHFQRVLWGSTGTKNPNYSDIKYVIELVGKNTVNTMPEPTFNAFLDHGKAKETLTSDASNAQKFIEMIRDMGVDINDVCMQLLKDGVVAFEKSFDSLLHSIKEKTKLI